MNMFVTVSNNEYSYEIQRSRFIGFCRRVENDEQAATVLAEIRKQYRDATHVCHAYITEESARSSDDGEPSGTAGMPIMESIRAAGLTNALVAVVRYFGGIKLGTGGLVRAYTQTASEALAGAAKFQVADCDVFTVSYDYAVWKKIEKRQLQSLYKIAGIEYNKTVEVCYATQDADGFLQEIQALTQGKCAVTPQGKRRIERSMA